MSKVLELKNLSYVYGTGTPFEKTAVNNLSLSIEKGEFIGIMGHTGSGKSTLVQMLNGLMKPTSGQVLLDGEDIWANPKDIRKIRFKVGMVFQYPEYQLFEETVAKDIAFGPTNMGKSGAELEKAVNDAARFTGLKDELLEKSPFDLSGGEKRRAAIAGVIAMNPEVLVLDEPTAGLDPMGRDVLLSQIVQYHKERKNTVILVSHSMEDIARVADTVAVYRYHSLYHWHTCFQISADKGNRRNIHDDYTLICRQLSFLYHSAECVINQHFFCPLRIGGGKGNHLDAAVTGSFLCQNPDGIGFIGFNPNDTVRNIQPVQYLLNAVNDFLRGFDHLSVVGCNIRFTFGGIDAKRVHSLFRCQLDMGRKAGTTHADQTTFSNRL